MRRLIGISLACLLTPACAIDNRPEQTTSQRPGEVASVPEENLEKPAYCSPLRATGLTLFGKAAWYNFVGKRTASGEILDTVTATAAHRSLPLASYAKVTNRDNGRSVIVKINDRGPYTPGRILDLSPRAADVLDMKRAGVTAVAIEPLADQASPSIAVFQTSGSAVMQ